MPSRNERALAAAKATRVSPAELECVSKMRFGIEGAALGTTKEAAEELINIAKSSPSGAKARAHFQRLTARVNSCPSQEPA